MSATDNLVAAISNLIRKAESCNGFTTPAITSIEFNHQVYDQLELDIIAMGRKRTFNILDMQPKKIEFSSPMGNVLIKKTPKPCEHEAEVHFVQTHYGPFNNPEEHYFSSFAYRCKHCKKEMKPTKFEVSNANL